MKLRQIASYFIFPAGILTAHLIASRILGLYARFPNLDIPFHLAGGVSISYTSARVLDFLQNEKLIARPDRFVFLLLLVTLTATSTVLWEFMEFAIDLTLHTNIQISQANTMQDQFAGLLGGSSVALWFSRLERKREKTH